MKEHKCELCNAIFFRKDHLTQHLNKLRKCNVVTNFSCEWCNKSFTSNSHLKRHVTTCKVKEKHEHLKTQMQTMDSEMAEKVRLLELKIIELKEMVDNGINPILSTQSAGINGNQNHTNHSFNTTTTNSNNINITINKYGYESLSHISPKQMVTIFRKCYESIPAFIMLKHFDNSAPQNRNVYIADLKSKYALTYDGNRWNITDRNDLLDEMYNDNLYYLEGKYEENYEDLDDTTATKFRTFLDSKDDDSTMKMVKDNIRKMLYNERNR
jgi:hypothetical protein